MLNAQGERLRARPSDQITKRLTTACLNKCNFGDCDSECDRAVTLNRVNGNGLPVYVPFSQSSVQRSLKDNVSRLCTEGLTEPDTFVPNPHIKTIFERSIDVNT